MATGRCCDGLLADDELRAAWRRAPCTRAGHHAYLGGLLEHTVAVATLAHETCQLHPRLNSDLLLTAAMTHDLAARGSSRYGAEIGLTEEGRLLGHLVIGEQMLTERSVRARRKRRLALLHCVLCHHGPSSAPGGRFGSAEALALYRLNTVDAAIKGAIEHGLDNSPRRIRIGAAGAWWPIRSSKPAGRGSPPLGRFDSFAASWLPEIPRACSWSGAHDAGAGSPRNALALRFAESKSARLVEWWHSPVRHGAVASSPRSDAAGSFCSS